MLPERYLVDEEAAILSFAKRIFLANVNGSDGSFADIDAMLTILTR